MKEFPEIAADFYAQGCSCSESVIKAAYEAKLIDQNLTPEFLNQIASPFSGAMGTGDCLCGAVAGSQIVLGLIFGRKSSQEDPHKIVKMAAELIKLFKEKRKFTCCKALSAKVKNDPLAKKENCTNIIKESATIMQSLIKEKTGTTVYSNL